MNYLVLGLIALAVGGALIGLLFTTFGKVIDAMVEIALATITNAKESSAAIRAQLLTWLRRHLQTAVTNNRVGDLETLEKTVLEVEASIAATGAWQPPRVSVAPFTPQRFRSLDIPAGAALTHDLDLVDLIGWLSASSDDPASLLAARADQVCKFPDDSPVILIAGTAPPKLLEPLAVAVPQPSFAIAPCPWWKRRLIEKAFASDIRAVAREAENAATLECKIAALNAEIAMVNAELQAKAAAFLETRSKTLRKADGLYAKAKGEYEAECNEERRVLSSLLNGYRSATEDGLAAYFETIGRLVPLLPAMPCSIKCVVDPQSGTLICDVELPDLTRLTVSKNVALKLGEKRKAANKAETQAALQKLHPSQLLLIGHELAKADTRRTLSSLALNGWVNYISRANGHAKTAYVASLLASADDLRSLVLSEIDPVTAFRHLKGRSALVVDDVVPIAPQLVLDRNDPRFTKAREVLDGLEATNNLATMPWEDFEHLIRELFERLYASDGVEVKVTQASRDRGVDAVVFDPDPLRGGKTIIQAKRYVNAVDVSAVRDLYGTLLNEGATRGILVTTSTYGRESYEFAKDKPLVLLNGPDLVSYLSQVGHRVRIDLEEARQLNRSKGD